MRAADVKVSRLAAFFVVCAAIAPVSGCSALPSTDRAAPTMQCEVEFRIDDNIQPLGPSEQFRLAASKLAAARPTATTTLDEVSREAGWTGRWDRVIQASDNTDSETINAAAGTTGVCFLGISRSDPDFGAQGDYIFFDGPRPVQTMYWDGSTEIMRALGASPSIQRDEPLTAETDSDPPMLLSSENPAP